MKTFRAKTKDTKAARLALEIKHLNRLVRAGRKE